MSVKEVCNFEDGVTMTPFNENPRLSPAPLNEAPLFYGKTVVQNNPILLSIP